MTTRIRSVTGRRIWDSRGRPTVEAEIVLEGGATGRGLAPAGASRGSHEAIDLRDGGAAFGGFGVKQALDNMNGPIARALRGLDAADQEAFEVQFEGDAEVEVAVQRVGMRLERTGGGAAGDRAS